MPLNVDVLSKIIFGPIKFEIAVQARGIQITLSRIIPIKDHPERTCLAIIQVQYNQSISYLILAGEHKGRTMWSNIGETCGNDLYDLITQNLLIIIASAGGSDLMPILCQLENGPLIKWLAKEIVFQIDQIQTRKQLILDYEKLDPNANPVNELLNQL